MAVQISHSIYPKIPETAAICLNRARPSLLESTVYRERQLVSCPRNNIYFAGSQLAVFQGASEAPLSELYGPSEQRRKTANRPRPRGLRSKWVVGKAVRAGLAVGAEH